MNERKLDIAKQIIKRYCGEARCGIYNSRNICGDSMSNIFDDGELSIDICYGYEYFEIFGLSDNDFAKLEKFYNSVSGKQPARREA